MAFEVGQATYRDAIDCLDEVVRMVRIGMMRDGTVTGIEENLAAAIETLKLRDSDRSSPLDEVSRIKLEVAEAMFFYQEGRYFDATRVLQSRWEELKPQLDKGILAGPRKDWKLNRPLTGQKVWAAMHYVFYDYYTCKGEYQRAIEEFKRIQQVILTAMSHGGIEPHTTFALFHYFIGQCYRAQRNFPLAEEHFFHAQQESVRRIEERIKATAITSGRAVGLGYEVAYNNVFSARVLGAGLSWVALHEGRLLKAAHLLSTAKALLACTGLTSLKHFMDMKFFAVMRRRARFDSPEYWEAMNDLEKCAEQFELGGDQFGKLRCARELVRGYLDLAEFGKDDKSSNLHQAKKWLDVLEAAKTTRSEVRYALQHVRYLFVTGDVVGTQRVYESANSLVLGGGDIAIESRIDLANMGALLAISRKKYDTARYLIENELDSPRSDSVVSDENRHIDPVLEGECYLLLTDAANRQGDDKAARDYLRRWELLSNFVENYYLHHIAKTLRRELKTPRFIRDSSIKFENKFLTAHMREYAEWLKDRVAEKYPDANNPKLAKIFGVSQATISRARKDGRLPPKTKKRNESF
jgi:hypothetical protein